MEFNLKVTEQILQIISAGLQELPMKVSFPVVQELQKQVNEQMAKVAPPDLKAVN